MSIAGKAAVSHDYEAKNGNLLKSTYANGWEVAYTYDNLDRVTEVKASKDGTSYTIGRYIYDKLGRVARFMDGQVSGKSCTYGYDLTDRLCEAVFDDGTAYRYTYDANDCLVKEVQTTPDGVRTVTRGYDADSRETSVACGSAKIEKTFDKLGRLTSIKRNGGKHTTTYTYGTASDGGQTGRIKTVKNGSGTWEYAYDAWGNVSKATENGSADSHTYTYDAQGQLIREYDPDKKLYLGYQYDAGGNLTEVRSYPAGAEGGTEGTGTVLKRFAYGSTWKDQLSSVTMDGKTRNFTYDANGSLLSDGKYTYSWTKGSLLEKVTGDGLEAVYTYDASGIRTSKKVNGITTEYLTAGGSVLSEKKNGVWQHYLYDGSGQLTAIRYKGADYYYIRDGLMSITGLVDANGTAVVNYRYDSWGMLTGITGSMAGTLGKDNPYRFKGYYYDEETGMYYLKSRYYQPEICRFISADNYASTGQGILGHNVYCYCGNNPVNAMDPDGHLFKKLRKVFNRVARKIVKATSVAKKVVKVLFGTSASVKSSNNVSYYTRTKFEKGLKFISPISFDRGHSSSQTISQYGNASKPIVFYTEGDISSPLSASVGVLINRGNSTNKINLAIDNIGVEVSYISNNIVQSSSKYFNLTDMKIHYKTSVVNQLDNMEEGEYTDIGIGGWIIVGALACVAGGIGTIALPVVQLLK